MDLNTYNTPQNRPIEERINIYLTYLMLSDYNAYNCICLYMNTGFDIIPYVEEWEKELQDRVAKRKIERMEDLN
jgi:hypothetical protein